MLSVQNGARAVEFYQAGFGAQVLFRHDDSKAGLVARLSANCSSLPGNLCNSFQQAARRVIDIQRRARTP